jgi:hypothetical protein
LAEFAQVFSTLGLHALVQSDLVWSCALLPKCVNAQCSPPHQHARWRTRLLPALLVGVENHQSGGLGPVLTRGDD